MNLSGCCRKPFKVLRVYLEFLIKTVRGLIYLLPRDFLSFQLRYCPVQLTPCRSRQAKNENNHYHHK